MNILINHCWCSDSIWGGHYDCRVIVRLERVPEGKRYHEAIHPDWALVQQFPFTPDEPRSLYDTTLRLRDDVVLWLNENVKDRNHKESPKAWAVGSDKYNSFHPISFCVFFDREKDGMAFIRRWSVHKNPVRYLQYFKDIRKKLDEKTGRMVRVPR